VNWLKLRRLRREGMQGHLNLMATHLLKCADTINELRLENQALRVRGNRLADAIEANDWTIESADRLCDSVAAWREFT